MLAARLCAAPLPRCGASSPGPKFTGESKVRWSSVIPTWHTCSARQVSTLSLSAPWSPNSLDLHPWSPNSFDRHPWSPNSLDIHPWSPNSLVLHLLLAAPLLREFAAYLLLLIFVGSYSTPHNVNERFLCLLKIVLFVVWSKYSKFSMVLLSSSCIIIIDKRKIEEF